MTLRQRVALYTVIGFLTATAAALLFTRGDVSGDFYTVIVLELVVIAPCWVLLLPAVIVSIPVQPSQAALFLIGAPAIAAITVPAEAYYFYSHARSNAMPDISWFWALAFESGLVALGAYGIYIISLNRLSRRRIQPTT
jgi:hypothetical protein